MYFPAVSRLVVLRPVSRPGLAVVLALCLVLSACGLGANLPEVACSPDLDIGTVCLPGGDQRAVELFAGVASEADAAAARMTDPLAGAINTQCFSLPPDVYTVCVSSENGITVVTPIVMPKDGRISFEGDAGLEDIPSVRLSEPLGLRRENAQFSVLIRDSDDKLLGTLGMGFYP